MPQFKTSQDRIKTILGLFWFYKQYNPQVHSLMRVMSAHGTGGVAITPRSSCQPHIRAKEDLSQPAQRITPKPLAARQPIYIQLVHVRIQRLNFHIELPTA